MLLLFIIGLELSPEKLWRMRDLILMLGTAQLVGTIVIIFGVVLIFFPVGPVLAVIIGLALALSSTAFAIQLIAEVVFDDLNLTVLAPNDKVEAVALVCSAEQ